MLNRCNGQWTVCECRSSKRMTMTMITMTAWWHIDNDDINKDGDNCHDDMTTFKMALESVRQVVFYTGVVFCFELHSLTFLFLKLGSWWWKQPSNKAASDSEKNKRNLFNENGDWFIFVSLLSLFKWWNLLTHILAAHWLPSASQQSRTVTAVAVAACWSTAGEMGKCVAVFCMSWCSCCNQIKLHSDQTKLCWIIQSLR